MAFPRYIRFLSQIKTTRGASPVEEMPILTKVQRGHGLSKTDFHLDLLCIPIPDTGKGFIDLLSNNLLRMRVE